MFHSRWWRVLGRHVAGLAVAFGALGPAQAEYVGGVWDPEFGSPFANLGWRGSILADVPADCSELPAGIRQLPTPGCSVPWVTVNATVEFFDINTPAVVVETLDFTASVSVTLLNVNGLGVIDGLGSDDPSTLNVVVAPGTGLSAFGVPVGTAWALKFEFVSGATVASLYWTSDFQQCFNSDLFCFEGRNSVDLPAQVTVTEVPEPASVGLSLLAMGLLGRRLRQRARLTAQASVGARLNAALIASASDQLEPVALAWSKAA